MGVADFGSGLLSKISTGFSGANNISSRGGYSRKHPIRVSAMKYVSAGFNFIVTLNEFTFGFKSVSGISVNRQVTTIPEGGLNDHGIIVEEPLQSSFTLSFSRGLMIRYPQLIDATARSAAAIIPNPIARKTALVLAASSSPQEALEKGPALGFIHVYDRTNKRLLGLYSFLSLGISEWRVSDLDAENGSGLLIEDMTIVHTGITREPTALQPFAFSSAINQESDVDRQARKAYERIEKAKEEAGYYDESMEDRIKRLDAEKKKINDKIEKMKKLVEQEAEPTAEDLKDFSEEEQYYIKQARLSKKMRKTEEEIKAENEAAESRSEQRKDQAKESRETKENDIDATEESKKEASKAASEKAEKIKKLIEQEEEPSESDLEEFSESEQNYIMQARFSKKTRKTDEEIKAERDRIKSESKARTEQAKQSREAGESARQEVEERKKEASKAASEKAEKIKELINQKGELSEDDLKDLSESEKNYIAQARFSKETKKTDEEIKAEKDKIKSDSKARTEQAKEKQAKNEEYRASAAGANKEKAEKNQENAQKVIDARKEKE